MPIAAILSVVTAAALGQAPATVEVRADNTVITKSCRVVIPADLVIEDTDKIGVIQIDADDITVEFAPGSVLRGAAADKDDDTLTGTGIRVRGHKGVTIKGAVIDGFRAGIHATDADGLTIEDCNIRRNYRARLRSSPLAEDGADWLFPHHNDENQWLRNYGAAVYVEDSKGVTLRRNTVRKSQNGLILDRVNDSKVYDNDCSFLSGWGLAMWRSSGNLVSRNAFDFCVRGYSHGVYNRGQDSAGILCFEQCSNNAFIENSATHGGDGFFGFAGLEALGETKPPSADFDYKGRGCNANLFVRNDLSYAPAHGLELTFSFDNWMIDNRFVQNNICGIWGGYSQRMNVVDNEFTGNGFKGAWEGGGINNEHSVDSYFAGNKFKGNSSAIAVWCRDNADFYKKPWGKANNPTCNGNIITSNSFEGDTLGWRMTDAGTVNVFGNSMDAAQKHEDKGKTTIKKLDEEPAAPALPKIPEAIGENRPLGARAALRGRENIVMGEWGPWDHESALIRQGGRSGGAVEYQVFGEVPGFGAKVIPAFAGQPDGQVMVDVTDGPIAGSRIVAIKAAQAGVAPFAVNITGEGVSRVVRGTIIQADWKATFFSWKDAADPRENLEGWRALARGEKAVTVDLKTLADMPFGHGGPKDQKALREHRDKLPGGDKFGMIARASVVLPKGKWKFSTMSDDGVRVTANGSSVIENWTWHGPTPNSGVFEQGASGPVQIVVEYFEIDGFATLSLNIEPME